VENEKNTQTAQAAEPAEPKAPAAEQPKEEKKARKSAKTADLEAKLEALQQELETTRDQYQRMLAEYANYKRRTEQEKEQIGAFTKAELLTGLLVSVDNMEKAMASMGIRDATERIYQVILEICR
jgi:molecular chaperone GrpE